MATSASSPGRRSSPALWAGLLVIAAVAWVLLIRQSPGLPGSMAGPWLVFGEFLLLWVVMMLAWTAFGLVAFGISRALGKLAPMSMGMSTGMSTAPSRLAVWSAAVALAVAGVYQFTTLKARCLRHCRSPLGFLLHFGNFRGRLRDVRVGIYHGGYCVGCCWSLMLVLVAVGVMNMAWMVALTAVVFAEKIWRSGQAFGYAVGALMITAALLLPWLPPVQTALLG
jgi:predicted metal-binding membrane protein